MRKAILFSSIAALLLVASAAAQPAAAPALKTGLDGLGDFLHGAMKDWKVPGLGIAVVQGDKVVLLKGYGYRDVEKQLPVTPQTLFAIGSITKSFTVTAMGMLIDQGKLDWDTPVLHYLPDFRMHDPVATEQMTPRDLVTHRSGLPRHDLVWYTSNFSREELVHRLRYLPPNKPFRSTFQYNNLMFMTAGYLVGKLNGTTWEEAVQKLVLDPLAMRHTNFSVLDSQKGPDFAQPYRKSRETEEVKQIPFYIQGAIGPAGEINSCAEDLGRYLLLHLNRGRLEAQQLLSENNAAQVQVPQMVIQGAPPYKELGTNAYGMGFFMFTYRGHKVVEHGGNIDGFSAELAFLPNDGIGVAVLTNLDGTPLPRIVLYNVFDRLLGLDAVPWNARLLALQQNRKESEQEAKAKGYIPRKPGTHPSHALEDFVGDYVNPGYGILSIERVDNGLAMRLNLIQKPLRHFHYDVFEVPENPLDPFEHLKAMFRMDIDGDIASVSMVLEPNADDIVFTRMPDKQLLEHNFVAAFTGQYELPGSPFVLTISLRGDHTLVASLPGQPDRELIPTRGTTFNFAGLNGINLEFKRDASGKFTEAAYHLLGTTLVLKKKP